MLSIDPSSPFTRGALLGDRIRLSDHFLDPGVFIRSMASRGALGGLSEAALQVALVMDAAGKDDVLIETVGVGQAEIDIVDHADTIVLALMPGSGDSIQALKAGVMEIPDVIVVNKADHPMTDTMVREVRGVLALSHDPEGWKVPILRTEAARGEGVEELAAKIDEHRAYIEAAGTLEERRARNLRSEVLGHRRLADAPPARGDRRRRPRDGRAARPGRAARARPGQRRRASCSRGTSMAEAARASTAEAMGWLGAEVDELGGDRGRPGPRRLRRRRERRAGLADRRASAAAAAPASSPSRSPTAPAPPAGSGSPRTREALRSAPVVDPTRPLLREHELTICAHYGIGERVGRAAEVAGRSAGDVTSRPA